jgi:hypothetical protein
MQMARKDINNLSAEELYELARQREQEEYEQEKEERRAQLAELRAERKKMLARHKREIAEIDEQIQALGGRSRNRAAKQGSQTGISSMVLEILAAEKKTDTKHIRAALEASGIDTTNLGQTLAYLKRTGRIKSAGRGVYAMA